MIYVHIDLRWPLLIIISQSLQGYLKAQAGLIF
nr:MAG TPA: hypothetical protein [Caudoviricetes sp.]